MRTFSRILPLVLLGALAGSASSVTLVFPDLILPAGPPDAVFTTSTLSSLGPLQNGATLSFTLETEGETWLSDLTLSIVDPGASTGPVLLSGAPDAPGDYSGLVSFASASPGSGVYALSFANTFGTAFDVTLSNLRLEVQPQPVPEPASLGALGLGALALVRRRPLRSLT